jgi:hypothetical protein
MNNTYTHYYYYQLIGGPHRQGIWTRTDIPAIDLPERWLRTELPTVLELVIAKLEGQRVARYERTYDAFQFQQWVS